MPVPFGPRVAVAGVEDGDPQVVALPLGLEPDLPTLEELGDAW